MQVERHHAVGAGAGDQVGDQLGRDRRARAGFAVLPGVAEIGDHRRDAPRRGAAQRVDDDQQFHQVVVGRERRRLDARKRRRRARFPGSRRTPPCRRSARPRPWSAGSSDNRRFAGQRGIGVAGDELDRSVLARHPKSLLRAAFAHDRRRRRGHNKAGGPAIRRNSLSRLFRDSVNAAQRAGESASVSVLPPATAAGGGRRRGTGTAPSSAGSACACRRRRVGIGPENAENTGGLGRRSSPRPAPSARASASGVPGATSAEVRKAASLSMLPCGDPPQHGVVGGRPGVAVAALDGLRAGDAQGAPLLAVEDVPDPGDGGLRICDLGGEIAAHPIGRGLLARHHRQLARLRLVVEILHQFWNCAGGRPSIDSKATVAPRGCAADNGAPFCVQPASATAHSAAVSTAGRLDAIRRRAARARGPTPLHEHPCGRFICCSTSAGMKPNGAPMAESSHGCGARMRRSVNRRARWR